jgi:hypothetical protein
MRDFQIKIPRVTILDWESRATRDKLIGGILLVSLINSDRKADPSGTGVKVMPAYWDMSTLSSLGYATLFIHERAPIVPSTTDMELITQLRALSIPGIVLEFSASAGTLIPGAEMPVSYPAPVPSPLPAPLPTAEFELAFIDFNTCKYLCDSNAYYYRTPEGGFTTDSSATAVRIVDSERAVFITRAVSIFKDGVTGIERFGSFNTILAKPYPEPVIVDANLPGAVAYTINPSCPPYWKPKAQYLESLGAVVASSREAAEDLYKAEEAARKRDRYLLWLLLIFIALLTGQHFWLKE